MKKLIVLFLLGLVVSCTLIVKQLYTRHQFKQGFENYVSQNYPQYKVDFDALEPRAFMHPQKAEKYNSSEHLDVILSIPIKNVYLENARIEATLEVYYVFLVIELLLFLFIFMIRFTLFRNN